jgi:hypothetical protein
MFMVGRRVHSSCRIASFRHVRPRSVLASAASDAAIEIGRAYLRQTVPGGAANAS